MVGRRAGTHSWVLRTTEPKFYPALANQGSQSQVDSPEHAVGALRLLAYYRDCQDAWPVPIQHTDGGLALLVAPWVQSLGGVCLSSCVACEPAGLLGEVGGRALSELALSSVMVPWSPSVSRYREWPPCAKCRPRLSEQERQMAALLMVMLGWRMVEESEEAVPRVLHIGDRKARTEHCQLGAVAEAP